MAKKMKGASLAESTPSGAHLEKDPSNDYEVQGHLRTLIEAHGIMSDPAKMEKVHKLAGRHNKAITSIQGIKDAYNAKFGAGAKKGGGAMVVDAEDAKDHGKDESSK
jgi:hypothetical protein